VGGDDVGPHRRADRGGLPGAGVTGSGARVGMNLLWLRPGVVGGSEEYLCRQLLGLLEIDHPFAIELFALPSFADAHPELAGRYPVVAAPVSGASRLLRV